MSNLLYLSLGHYGYLFQDAVLIAVFFFAVLGMLIAIDALKKDPG